MKYLAYASLLLLGACGGSDTKPNNHLTFNDFESIDGWGGAQPNPSLTKEKAHSGVYSIKVDPATEYSLGYVNTLNRLAASRADVNKMNLHGWVFVPNDKNRPQMVLELVNPTDGKQIQRDVVDLHKVAVDKGFGKWVEFDQPVTMPASATAFSQIKLYLWRAESYDPVFVDDVSLDRP